MADWTPLVTTGAVWLRVADTVPGDTSRESAGVGVDAIKDCLFGCAGVDKRFDASAPEVGSVDALFALLL